MATEGESARGSQGKDNDPLFSPVEGLRNSAKGNPEEAAGSKRSSDEARPEQPPPVDAASLHKLLQEAAQSLAPGYDESLRPQTARLDRSELTARITGQRRNVGYALGFLTILGAASFFVWSIFELDSLVAPPTPEQERFALAKLGAHAVITVAFMYFVYSVLRVAERMVIPFWWSMSYTRLLLGAPDPARTVVRIVERLSRTLNKLGLVVVPEKKDASPAKPKKKPKSKPKSKPKPGSQAQT